MVDHLYIYSVYNQHNWQKFSFGNGIEKENYKTYKYEDISTKDQVSLIPNADNFRQRHLLRYHIIRNSLVQHKSFCIFNPDDQHKREVIKYVYNESNNSTDMDDVDQKLMPISIESSRFIIHSIKQLHGTNGNVTCLGILNRDEENNLYLEDTNSLIRLKIDTDVTLFGPGIYCCDHIVVTHGYLDKISNFFVVKYMFHPPYFSKSKDISKLILDNSTKSSLLYRDIFKSNNFENSKVGCLPLLRPHIPQTPNFDTQKDQISNNNEELNISKTIDLWIIISDVVFTNSVVLTSLDEVFSGYNGCIENTNANVGFILFGNFIEDCFFDSNAITNIYNAQSLSIRCQKTQEGFENFYKVISKYPQLLKRSLFFFLPGPSDIGPDLLPKPPIIDYYTSNIREKLNDLQIFMNSNPMRLEHKNINMFFARISLSTELKEKALFAHCGKGSMGLSEYWILNSQNLESLLPPTILGQSHICPTSTNIVQTLDPTLLLCPIPNIIIIGDSGPGYSIKPLENVWITNPGSFKNTRSWIQYDTKENTLERISL
ncbi:DNA polymerase epsilon subunit B family protein [Cryptosporidium andersoni]|uniref:DNA polymerase II subunit 2 n=1 Tax=Cryptosporidium andersoni TaxID=117008 RepID=A0A1J4MBM5_9CRYT|nr:DNA polymerase epsilon subunit B family protein [Cryptosporidium andersoni]